MPDPLAKGREWLEEQFAKMSKMGGPRGVIWRGKSYFAGDPMPRSLKKRLRKIIAEGRHA